MLLEGKGCVLCCDGVIGGHFCCHGERRSSPHYTLRGLPLPQAALGQTLVALEGVIDEDPILHVFPSGLWRCDCSRKNNGDTIIVMMMKISL